MTFITVIYGDNEQRMFNPHCTSLILLECIRKHCCRNDGNDGTLDLTDAVGNMKHLPDHLNSYANMYLEGRTKYWLVKVEKGITDEDPTRYTLLTNNSEKYYPDLSHKLQELSRPPSPSGRQSWATVRKKLPKTIKGSKRTHAKKR
ncbi:uncharacterized protein CXorf65-like [Amphiura filiformis]|uniref:uncharacterized protein CXorf65-like n=1 Tax=Amphiura filiformis TaxID=82378 RepID=UPI003B211A8D